jgi:hypothetical protein
MPRPSPNERRKIEARKKANAMRRNDEASREKRVAAQVEKIVSGALTRTRGREAVLPDLPELLERLEEARLLAMASGQANAAVAATMAEAKLCGYVIDKSQSAIAVAGSIGVSGMGSRKEPQTIEDIVEDMRENLGDRAAQTFIVLLRGMGFKYDGGDVDPIETQRITQSIMRRLGSGDVNGADHD